MNNEEIKDFYKMNDIPIPEIDLREQQEKKNNLYLCTVCTDNYTRNNDQICCDCRIS